MAERSINYKVLLVDDDTRFHKRFREALGGGLEIEGAVDEAGMWKKLQEIQFDVLLLDLMLDGKDIQTGLKLIKPLTEKKSTLPIIVITADDKINSALFPMKMGAKSFLSKQDPDIPYWKKQITEVIGNSKKDAEIERLRKGDGTHKADFIGESKVIQGIRNKLELLSQKPNVTVLLTGETGVGKDAAANYMHSRSIRREKKFVPVNLSAISKSLMESELFGIVKGAFTGATDNKIGYFQQANGGILMLDEIADIDHDIQVKMLRFFDHKVIRPVGGKADIVLDLQIVAATNKNLDLEVQKGTFREDLRYRMNYKIEIPPLRARKEDIVPIFEFFINQKHHLDPQRHIVPEVVGKILKYEWPGNVRQLRNLVDAMVLERSLLNKEIIDMECYEAAFDNVIPYIPTVEDKTDKFVRHQTGPIVVPETENQDRKRDKAIEDMQQIESLLKNQNYKKTAVAKTLGYKGLDNMRARIKTCYGNFPEVFEHFPTIKSTYLKEEKSQD